MVAGAKDGDFWEGWWGGVGSGGEWGGGARIDVLNSGCVTVGYI